MIPSTNAPLLPALVGQLLGVDRAPHPRISEKRRARMEKMLVLLLTHGNMPRSRFASVLEVSETTTSDDAAARADPGAGSREAAHEADTPAGDAGAS